MKKFILSGLFAFSILMAMGQGSCFPNPLFVIAGLPGLWPNPQLGPLPDGNLNQPYGQTITVIVPADTTLDLSQFGLPFGTVPVSINNLDLVGVSGLPLGMSYICDNSGCTWPNNDFGCFRLSGTPTVAGIFQVTCTTSLNVNLPNFGAFQTPPGPVTYDLTILGPTGAEEGLTKDDLIQSVNPNPASNLAQVDFFLPNPETVHLRLLDLRGKLVRLFSEEFPAGMNMLELDLETLSSGLYLIELWTGSGSHASRKLMVQ
jgi:hypothetical protein